MATKWYQDKPDRERAAREAIERQGQVSRPGIVGEHRVFFERLKPEPKPGVNKSK
jgi:hypothetical protein